MSYQTDVFTFDRPFIHSFGQSFFLYLNRGHLAFLTSMVCPSGYHGVLNIHVFCNSVQHICHGFRILLVDGKEKISRLESIGESCDQDLTVGFINQKGFFVKPSYI